MDEANAKKGSQIFFYRQDMKPIWRTLAVLLALFLLFAAVNLNKQVESVGKAAPPGEADAFKTLNLKTLDGGVFTAEDLGEYEVIVVDVWATWCFHCIEEMPTVAKFSDSLGRIFPDNKVLYIGLCTDLVDAEGNLNEELLGVARDISRKAGVHYPQLIADKEFNDAFTKPYIVGLPSIFYLDGDGNVIDQTGGLSANGYALQIINLLEERKEA